MSENARLVTATVKVHNPDAALLEFTVSGRMWSGVTPVAEFLPGHRRSVGICLVAFVCDETDRPLLSAARPQSVAALLARISPEIRSGAVVVKAVARRAGIRTKVAVAATEPGVDAIAARVGRQHNRVDYVKNAVAGERVDIIAWNPDWEIFLRNALQPAEASSVTIDPHTRTAVAVVPEHQMSAAVGVVGANSALAGQLVGLQIRIEAA